MNTELQRDVIELISGNVRNGMSALYEKMNEIESTADRETLLVVKVRLALLTTVSMYLLDPLKEQYSLIENNDGKLTSELLLKMFTDMEELFVKEVMKGFD